MAANDEKYFIRNLKNYMTENHLSQSEMGRKMGVAQATIANIINEKFKVSMHVIHKFCELSGMSIAQAFSPDPKQFGTAVEGDVQDVNAVAMMELMKKQMEELKEENEKLKDANARVNQHDISLVNAYEELKKENLRLLEGNKILSEEVDSLNEQLAETEQDRNNISCCWDRTLKENEELKQENLRLVSEGYHAKNEPVKFDKWKLVVDSTDCTGSIDIGGDQIEVYDVNDIDPYEKKVSVKLYFDEIIIK